MAASNLFPNDGPLTSAADRTEPSFWLRRLIVLPELSLEARPIRDIVFRRGLNIIQTELRNETDEAVLGHDVGKTLLTRLIRYTLGEQMFARRSEYRRILDHLPTAAVITQ